MPAAEKNLLISMSSTVPPPEIPWKRSRSGFVALHLSSLLFVWWLVRLVLFLAFPPAPRPLRELVLAFLSGFQRDLFVGLALTLPLLGWMWVVPTSWCQRKWHHPIFWTGYFLFWFVGIFLLFTEFFFFEEFRSRFNTVAVDYVQYPQEVFTNIWESYHVGIVITVCLALSLAWVLCLNRLFSRMWERPFSLASRLCYCGVALALMALLIPTMDLRRAHVSNDRTLNELANNGLLSFAMAAWTRHLDYAAFYRTLAPAEAYRRARRLLQEPNTAFVNDAQSIRRRVEGDPARPGLNLVLFLEESL